MFRRLSTVFLLTLFAFSITALAGGRKLVRAQKVSTEDEARWFENFQNLPDYPSAIVMENSDRQELGRTWYDYPSNTTTGRMMAYSSNGNIHFTFMKILPNGAERYVTYAFYDIILGLFFGDLSVDESLGRSGWGKILNGKDDEALITFHSNTLGGVHVYADAGEGFYSFNSTYDNITAAGAVFPGFDRIGDRIVLMHHGGTNWLTDPVVAYTDNYMATWNTGSFAPLDPATTDVGHSEIWPSINPMNPAEFSYLYAPNSTATAGPNGSLVFATTVDNGVNYTQREFHIDDFFYNAAGGQYIIENFSQQNSLYTSDSVFHAVYGATQGSSDSIVTQINGFPILYWNTDMADEEFSELTSPEAGWPADSATQVGLANFRPGNGLGNAYPNIAKSPDDELVVIWQQWEDDGAGGLVTVVPSGGVEIFVTDIWGAYSPDGGNTWGPSFRVAGSAGVSDVYPNLPQWFFQNAAGDSIVLDIIYMEDTEPGTSLFGGGNNASECVWWYEGLTLALADISPVGGIDGDISGAAKRFTLAQNYPNPFNPATTITFNLTKTTNVSLDVFNLLGEKVATLVNGRTTAGEHTLQFDATNLSSGIYFYTLTANNLQQTRKMILMK